MEQGSLPDPCNARYPLNYTTFTLLEKEAKMNIIVAGSQNMDLFLWIPNIPRTGEIRLRVYPKRFGVVRAQPSLSRYN